MKLPPGHKKIMQIKRLCQKITGSSENTMNLTVERSLCLSSITNSIKYSNGNIQKLVHQFLSL